MNIIGRIKEQETLKQLLDSKKAEFLVLYGRRRVGKTFLIKEFFNETFSFYSTGGLSKKIKDELKAFNQSLKKYGSNDISIPKNWFEAFESLQKLLENNVINLCEIKFSNNKYTITDQYKNNIINKIETLRNIQKSEKQIIVTFITLNGINKANSDIVRKEIIASDLFIQK